MLVFKTFSALALGLALSTSAVQALSLQQGAQPAEFPPASYTADIYVDSRGCMYIRAGFSGAVTWVPRVSRSREVVCGAQPSLGGAGTQAATAPVVAPASAAPAAPVVLVVAPPAAQVAAPAAQVAAPAAQVAAPVVLSPPPAPTVLRTPIAAAAPIAIATAPIAPTALAVSTAITRSVTLTCPIGGANSNVRSSGVTLPLRCAAGQVGSITYVVAHTNGQRTRVTVNAAPPVVAPIQVATPPVGTGLTICPSLSAIGNVYTNGATSVRCGPQVVAPVPGLSTGAYGSGVITNPVTARPVVIPTGYRAAWDDGRLNPNRGPRTALGTAQMNQVWTQTLPRTLVQAAPVVTTARARAPIAVAPATPIATGYNTGRRYVQVATFGNPANAQRTITRLQGMGLIVGVSNVTRSGKSYQIIMAGPFTQQAALNAALSQVRGAGFGDAYTR